MAKIKGVRKLNKVLKETFKDFEINRFFMNKEWLYNPNKNEIAYTLTEGTFEDIWFNEFVKKRFGYKVKNTFMITVLHEVGHRKTLDDVYENDVVYEFCKREKDRIEKEMKKAETTKQCKKLEFEYFSLPDEIIATEWAVNYAKEHEKELDEMWERIQDALVEFYAKNITE